MKIFQHLGFIAAAQGCIAHYDALAEYLDSSMMDQEELRHRLRNNPRRVANGNALASDPIHRKYMNDPKYNRKAFEI